jgi:Late embryogenesis abundant protein
MNLHISGKQTSCSLLALALLSGFVLTVLGGCNGAVAPRFRAVGVREIESDNERTVIEFTVEATNPNVDPIPLRQINYSITMNGEVVFTGVRSPETTLHTFSSHVFKLPAVLPTSVMNSSGELAYSLTGTAQYIPPGRLAEVLFDAELKVPEAPINLVGSINLDNSTNTDQ